MRTSVIVRLQVDGMHNFPKAAELFPEVAFLAERHRHIFHIEAKKEFLMFKKDITDYLKQMYYKPETRTHEFGAMSCEMIAKIILNQFNCTAVSVWEDLENGAIVEA